MADSACCDVAKVDYLHPEILSAETLLAILKERKVFVSEMDILDKYKLVELFYDHVMPLPQRIYGDGRREQRLARHQKSNVSLKRKNECGPEQDNEDGKSRKLCCVPSNSPKCADRLKSPSGRNGSTIVKLTSNRSYHNHCPNNNLSVENKISDTNQLVDSSPSKKRKFQKISWP